MKTQLSNWANFMATTNRTMEINESPSLTVPGMTMSLIELEKRYVRGQGVPLFRQTIDNDLIPDDFNKMDTMEKIDHGRELGKKAKREEKDLLQFMEDQAKAAADKASEESIKTAANPTP